MKSSRSVVVVLCAAQFVMVLDSSVMNVSISQLVEDFDTSITTIQAIITAYALVMAATMIAGGKIGDIIGRRKAFTIGMAVYGAGSLLTAVSWNVGVLFLGWSVLEGLGAALVMPALTALVAGNFEGSARAQMYGLLGGVAGAGVAVGPILGGWTTANLSWRLVFAGEVVIVIVILFMSHRLGDTPREGARPTLDVVGALLAAVGIGLAVYGVLQSSSWGWITPRNSPVEPFGFSLTLFVVAAGLLLVWGLFRWMARREAHGEEPLFRRALLDIPPVRAGLSMFTVQNLIMMGVFFILPLYLQVVQGFDAFETGVRMLPISVALLLSAVLAPKLSAQVGPRRVVRLGLLLLLAAVVIILTQVSPEIDRLWFSVGMAVLGTGMGMVSSQLPNVVQSSVEDRERSEVGGLQATSMQLGAAIGTALMGAVVIGSLATAVERNVIANPAISDNVKAGVSVQLQAGVSFVPADDVRAAALDAGVSPEETEQLVADYEDGQIEALHQGLLVAGFIILGGLVVAGGLPRRLRGPDDEPVSASTGAAPSGP
jgi:EmrB/QacA subfamily drug resistance transporter